MYSLLIEVKLKEEEREEKGWRWGEDMNISATGKMMGQDTADMVEERFSFSYPPPPPKP